MDTVPEFHAEAPQATMSEGLAQGLYVAARVEVEPLGRKAKTLPMRHTRPTCFTWYFMDGVVHEHDTTLMNKHMPALSIHKALYKSGVYSYDKIYSLASTVQN